MIILSMNLLSIKEAAEKLGVSARRVNQLIDEKKLPAQKIGSQYVINEGDLEKVTIHGKAGRPKKETESAKK
jgi:excisionase family DNA binding protein